MNEEEVVKIIRSMPTKSCETDAIPTMLLKQILDKVGGTITSIVNVSLTEACICNKLEDGHSLPSPEESGA